MMISSFLPFLAAILAGEPVKLPPDTFDLTGLHSILVTSRLEGSPGTVIRTGGITGDTTLLFNLQGAEIDSIHFIGPNATTHTQLPGYAGCLKVLTRARISNCTFTAWDKWAVNVRGVRGVLTDTTQIIRCRFEDVKRDGYGYGVWNQYGTVLIVGCAFDGLRHGIDGSSEGSRYIVLGSSFNHCYLSAIHQHEYTGGLQGAGIEARGNGFYKNGVDIDTVPPFPPAQHVFSGNQHGLRFGQSSFWIAAHGVRASVILAGGDTIRLGAWRLRKWTFLTYPGPVRLLIDGTGVAYIDQWGGESFEAASALKIKYITPSGTIKADRFVGEQVAGDYSLRIRLAAGKVEIYE